MNKHSTDSVRSANEFADNRVDLVLRIPGGSGHHVSLRVIFDHLKQALKDTSATAGEYAIIIDHDGCVWVNGENMFTPKSLIVKDGAA